MPKPNVHSVYAAPERSRPLPAKTKRFCLGPDCRGKYWFLSEGPGHRYCPECLPRVRELTRRLNAAALAEPIAPDTARFDETTPDAL